MGGINYSSNYSDRESSEASWDIDVCLSSKRHQKCCCITNSQICCPGGQKEHWADPGLWHHNIVWPLSEDKQTQKSHGIYTFKRKPKRKGRLFLVLEYAR